MMKIDNLGFLSLVLYVLLICVSGFIFGEKVSFCLSVFILIIAAIFDPLNNLKFSIRVLFKKSKK